MRRKKHFAGIIGACMLVFMLCCLEMTAYAATSSFSLTVTRTGYDQDAKSKKTLKAGGALYENKFYATAQTFNRTGRMQVRSVQYKNKVLCTDWNTFDSSGTKKVRDYYNSIAKDGKYYYLQGAYSSSSNNYSLTVTGRYTP